MSVVLTAELLALGAKAKEAQLKLLESAAEIAKMNPRALTDAEVPVAAKAARVAVDVIGKMLDYAEYAMKMPNNLEVAKILTVELVGRSVLPVLEMMRRIGGMLSDTDPSKGN